MTISAFKHQKWDYRWTYLAIFVLAFATRLIGVWLGGARGDDSDGCYLLMAKNFLNGDSLSFIHGDFGRLYAWLPPGMSFIYMAALVLFKNIWFPLRMFFTLLSSGMYVVFFCLAKRVLPPRYAITALFTLVFYPPQWLWSTRINPHTYATDVMVICLFLLFKAWESQKISLFFFVGALWTSVGLNRGEYMFGIGVLLAATFFAFRHDERKLKYLGALLLGWVLLLVPWVSRNYRLFNRILPISTNYGDSFWETYNPKYHFGGAMLPQPPQLLERMKAEPNEVGRADLLMNDAKAYMKANPGRVLYIAFGNAVNFWRPWISATKASIFEIAVYVLSYVPIFFFFILGLRAIAYKDPHWIAIVGMVLYKFLIHIPFYMIVLFRESVMPLIILVAIAGLQDFNRRLRNS